MVKVKAKKKTSATQLQRAPKNTIEAASEPVDLTTLFKSAKKKSEAKPRAKPVVSEASEELSRRKNDRG